MGIRKVSAEEFETAFNNAQLWLLHKMFVGYHSNFKDCECYLTPANLGGFAITPRRELVNVFNCEGGISLLGDEEVKKIILSKVDWFVVLGYYEKETRARKDICNYYRQTLGFINVCQTVADISDMANHKGLDYALQFIDQYGVPYQTFMVNPRFNKDAWDWDFIPDDYADGVTRVLRFIDTQNVYAQSNINAIADKLKDYWRNKPTKEIIDAINKIYPGVLDDVHFI